MQGIKMNADEEIRQIAYRLWQEEGCPDGQEVQHWLRAQLIWEETNRPQSKPKSSPYKRTRKGRQPIAEREL